MNDAALYNKSNIMPKRDVLRCLQEYRTNAKWKHSSKRIIDIGCGDGSVTIDILKKFVPPNYEKIVGCDISEEMVKFAQENYSTDNIEFKVLNIEGQLPETMRNSFDHAFSFYALQWVRNQKKAFTNIYELLREGGGCLLILLGHLPLYDIWRQLSRMDRWRPWLKDVERYVGAYHDSQDPEKQIEQIMKNIGFTNIEVIRKPLSFAYPNIHVFKSAMTSVNPFQIPKDILNDYLEDMVDILRCINEANVNNRGLIDESYHYDLLIISGNK